MTTVRDLNVIPQKIAKLLIKTATRSDSIKMAARHSPYIYLSNSEISAKTCRTTLIVNYQIDLNVLGDRTVFVNADEMSNASSTGDVFVDGTHLRGTNGYSCSHTDDKDNHHDKIHSVIRSLYHDWQYSSVPMIGGLKRLIKSCELNGSRRIHIVAGNEQITYAVEYENGNMSDTKPLCIQNESPINPSGHLIIPTRGFKTITSCISACGSKTENFILWRNPKSDLCGIAVKGSGYIAIMSSVVDWSLNKPLAFNEAK